jgi:hypothetical protein
VLEAGGHRGRGLLGYQIRDGFRGGLRILVFSEPTDVPALLGEDPNRLSVPDPVGVDPCLTRSRGWSTPAADARGQPLLERLSTRTAMWAVVKTRSSAAVSAQAVRRRGSADSTRAEATGVPSPAPWPCLGGHALEALAEDYDAYFQPTVVDSSTGPRARVSAQAAAIRARGGSDHTAAATRRSAPLRPSHLPHE